MSSEADTSRRSGKFCEHCGSQRTSGDRPFCGSCGRRFEESAAPIEPHQAVARDARLPDRDESPFDPAAAHLSIARLPAGFELQHRDEAERGFVEVFGKRVMFGTRPAIWWQVGSFDSEDEALAVYVQLIQEHEVSRRAGLFKAVYDFKSLRFEPTLGDAREMEHVEIDRKRGLWAAVCDRNVVYKLSTTGVDADSSLALLEELVSRWPPPNAVDRRRRVREMLNDAYPSVAFRQDARVSTDWIVRTWGELRGIERWIREISEWQSWTEGAPVSGHLGALLRLWTEVCRIATQRSISAISDEELEKRGVPAETLDGLSGYSGGVLARLDQIQFAQPGFHYVVGGPAHFAVIPLDAQLDFWKAHVPAIIEEMVPELRTRAREQGLAFP